MDRCISFRKLFTQKMLLYLSIELSTARVKYVMTSYACSIRQTKHFGLLTVGHAYVPGVKRDEFNDMPRAAAW